MKKHKVQLTTAEILAINEAVGWYVRGAAPKLTDIGR